MKFVYINTVSDHFNNPPFDTIYFAVKEDSIDQPRGLAVGVSDY